MRSVKVIFERIHPDARVPTKAYPTDAGFDFYACEDVLIPPREMREVRTGVRLCVPEGWCMLLKPRSSQGKRGIQIHQGVYDAYYTGELTIFVYNHTDDYYKIEKGDKIAQGVFVPVWSVEFVEGKIPELDESKRGERGLGSTGR